MLVAASVLAAASELTVPAASARSYDRPPECSDGIDNDRDDLIDAEDEDCGGPDDESESRGRERQTLRLAVSDGKEFAEPNEILTYRIVVENTGSYDRDFSLRTDLNPSLILLEASDAPQVDNRILTWRTQPIAAGEVREFFITAYVERDSAELKAVQVRVYAEDALASDTTSIRTGLGNGDFGVAVSDAEENAVPGSTLTYTIIVRNNSNRLATDVEVNDALPTYTEFVAATEGGQWTGKNVRWTGLTVSPEGERKLQVTARVRTDAPLGAELRNAAEVRGNTAVDITTVSDHGGEPAKRVTRQRAPLELSKVADRSEVQPGSTVGYTIRLRNNTDRTFHNIEVQDRLDMQYMHVMNSGRAQRASDRLMWTVPVLQPGDEWTTYYQVEIARNVPHGYTLNNVVSVSGDGFDAFSLTERVYTSSIGVITDLPKTGAGIGGFFLILSGIAAATATGAHRRFFL